MFEVRVFVEFLVPPWTLDFIHPETHHLKDSEHVGMCLYVFVCNVVNPNIYIDR